MHRGAAVHPSVKKTLLGLVAWSALAIGCESKPDQTHVVTPAPSVSAAPPPTSSVVMPTPSSVSFKEPGGDAPDKEAAALTRLAENVAQGWRSDKFGTLKIRLVDPKQWRRVTVFGTPTRATYQYGEQAYALELVMYQPSEGASDPKACLRKFLKFADETATTYDIEYKVSPLYDRDQTVDGVKKPIAVALVEGRVNSPFLQNDYTAAVVAYQSFTGTCLVQAFAAVATHHPDIAKKARDTWINQAAPQLHWDPKKVTDTAPPFDAN